MKKTLLILSLAVSLNAAAQKQVSQVFDFSSPTTLSPAVTPEAGNGGRVTVNGKTFKAGSISTSAIKGESGYGVTILTEIFGQEKSYSLEIQRASSIKITASGNATLDRIAMSDDSNVDYLRLKDDNQPGTLTKNEWKKKDTESNVKNVTLSSYGGESFIKKLTVYYTVPSDILIPTADIENGATLSSFNKINLTFSNNISISSTDGITLKDGSGYEYNLNTTVDGKTVTLASATEIKKDGEYTINIPARSFKDSEGYENTTLTYTFKIEVPKNTFTYTDVTPQPGRVEKIIDDIVLTFPSDVTGFTEEGAKVSMTKDGELHRALILEVDQTEQNKVHIKFANIFTEITDNGTYKINIPEMTIYNAFKGYDGELYNPAFTLTYEISDEPMPDSETMTLAKELLKKSGTGYPKENSTARVALNTLTEQSPAPDDTEIESAIENFYKETDIELPETGKYYSIASINTTGEKLWLCYDNGNVSLTTDGDKATAFCAEEKEDGTIFQTSDGKYLHVLSADDNKYAGTSSSNITEEYNADVNDLTLKKFSVAGSEASDMFGLLSMKGGLGNDIVTQNPQSAYALVSHDNKSVMTDPSYGLYFQTNLTSAFIIEETNPQATPVELGCSLAQETIAEYGDMLTLVFTHEGVVTLANTDDAYIESATGENVGSAIITPTGDNGTEFTIGLPELGDGKYTLIIPTGTFTINDKDIETPVKAISLTFNIDNSIAGDFIYDYDFFVYNNASGYVTDTYFNNFVIFSKIALAVDKSKKVLITKWSNAQDIVASGHFEETTIEERPEVNALKLVLDKPITSGSIQAGAYAVIIEKATLGDSNFGTYLKDKSVSKSDCHVNDRWPYQYNVDNNKATSIEGIEADTDTDMRIYNIMGQPVKSMNAPGVYIMNGKKYIKRK